MSKRKALPKLGKVTCAWTEDADGVWETSCGQAWTFETGGIKDNKVKFCYCCGNVVREIRRAK